jgi:hypothetical protein
MKTTIKLTTTRAMSVHPCKNTGGVVLEITDRAGGAASTEAMHLTADQVGALLYGIETAAEAAAIAQDRATA